MRLMARHIAFSTLCLAGLLYSSLVQGQNYPQFAQYQFGRSFFNAAANGAEEGFSGLLTHRSQWIGFKDAPMTQGVSATRWIKVHQFWYRTERYQHALWCNQ